MFCQQCGSQVSDSAAFCANCGANLNPSQPPVPEVEDDERTVGVFAPAPKQATPAQTPVQQTYVQPTPPVQPVTPASATQQNAYDPNAGKAHNGSVGFGQAVSLFFKNYTNFSGRASKSEYWWAFLFNCLVSLVASLLSGVIPPLGGLLSVAIMIPGISLSVRRLHDVGKSGAWWFMGLIPFVGGIILLIQFLKDSDGDNQYGPGPVSM